MCLAFVVLDVIAWPALIPFHAVDKQSAQWCPSPMHYPNLALSRYKICEWTNAAMDWTYAVGGVGPTLSYHRTCQESDTM